MHREILLHLQIKLGMKLYFNLARIKTYFPYIKNMRRIFLITFSYTFLLFQLKAEVSTKTLATKVNLSSPYDTVNTHFTYLSPGNESFKKVGIVFVHGERSPEKSNKMATKLKQLLTFYGITVDHIPNNPNYIDPIVNEHRYVLSKKLPQVYLLKYGEEWRYSEETWKFIKQYQKEGNLELFLCSFLPKKFCKTKILDLAIWQYIVLIGLVLIIWLIHRIAPLFLNPLVYHIMGPGKKFSIERLVLFLSTIFLLKITLPVLHFERVDSFVNRALEATVAFILMCLAYECVGIIQVYLKDVNQHNKFMIHILPLYSMVAKVIIIVFGLIKTIDGFGFDTKSLVQALSFGTLGLGLASQDTIKNLFGSLMIIMDSPFSVGDEITTGHMRGKVEEIGLRATLLRTKEGSLVYIPNAKLADAYIDNFGRRTSRLVDLEIPISYNIPLDVLSKFMKGLHDIKKSRSHIKQQKTAIYFDRINEYGCIIVFNIYLDTKERAYEQECKNIIIPSILKLANELGIHLGIIRNTTDDRFNPIKLKDNQ